MAKKSKRKVKAPTGKQILEINILDDETRKQVIKCIEERGKISVFLKPTGTAEKLDGGDFAQQVD